MNAIGHCCPSTPCTPGYERFVNSSTYSLQQLSMYEFDTNIPDIFLEMISAHGGIVH